MRRAELRSAVIALDMAAAAELTSVSRMRAYLATRHSWNGGPLVADALELADERSRSPSETRMRLIWILDAGLPRPVCNRAVFSLTGELLGVHPTCSMSRPVSWASTTVPTTSPTTAAFDPATGARARSQSTPVPGR